MAGGLLLGLILAVLVHQVGDSAAAGKGKSKKRGGGATIASKSFQMSKPNDGQRFTVTCPKGKFPFGGGMVTKPGPDPRDGEGIYPHSYERLGVQHGYHVTAILFDPSPSQTVPRTATVQVVCGPQLGNITPPHVTRNLSSGESAKLVAKCPGKRYLVGGGFQRTNWTNFGGTIATESRAISSKAWRVSGINLGRFDGELTAIAYCKQSKKPFLTTVSDKITVPRAELGTATTPKCPKGRTLTFGGWAAPDAGRMLMTDGYFTKKDAWTTSAFNSGVEGKLTAYGYCYKV